MDLLVEAQVRVNLSVFLLRALSKYFGAKRIWSDPFKIILAVEKDHIALS